MYRKMIAGACALAVLLGAAACSSDDSSSSGGSGELADQIKQAAEDEGADITDEEASCAAEAMVAILGEDEAEAAVAEGSAGMEQAMESFTEALAGSLSLDEAQEMVDNMLSISDECLDQLGVDKSELEALAGTEG